jgi:hypothetical protein
MAVASTSFATDGKTPEAASEATAEGPAWFGHVGFGPRFGAVFQSRSSNDGEFPASAAGGWELAVGAFSMGMHTVTVGAGYLKLERHVVKGPAQVKMDTSYERVDIWLGYDFNWELLLAGLRLGTALSLVNTEMTYGAPTWEIVDEDGDGEDDIVFAPSANPAVVEHSGVEPGFMAGLGIGLSPGKILFERPGVIEVRAQADYVRRGARNDFSVWGLISFWPSRLAKPGR